MKETQLQRVIRKSEQGQFGDDYTISISRYGYKLVRLGVKPRGLKRVLKKMGELYPEVFEIIKKSETKAGLTPPQKGK